MSKGGVIVKVHPDGVCDLHRFANQHGRDLIREGIVRDGLVGLPGEGTDGVDADVDEELAPEQLPDIRDQFHLRHAAFRHGTGDRLSLALVFGEAAELGGTLPLVENPAGPGNRRAAAACPENDLADGDIFLNIVGIPVAVLQRADDGVRTDQRAIGLQGLCALVPLCQQDHEIGRRAGRGVCRGTQAGDGFRRPVQMGKLQPVFVDGVHMSLHDVNQQHAVLPGQVHAVNAAHGSRTDNANIHIAKDPPYLTFRRTICRISPLPARRRGEMKQAVLL